MTLNPANLVMSVVCVLIVPAGVIQSDRMTIVMIDTLAGLWRMEGDSFRERLAAI